MKVPLGRKSATPNLLAILDSVGHQSAVWWQGGGVHRSSACSGDWVGRLGGAVGWGGWVGQACMRDWCCVTGAVARCSATAIGFPSPVSSSDATTRSSGAASGSFSTALRTSRAAWPSSVPYGMSRNSSPCRGLSGGTKLRRMARASEAHSRSESKRASPGTVPHLDGENRTRGWPAEPCARTR